MLFFCNRTLNCKSFLEGTLDHGIYTPGASIAFTIQAGVQEVTPQELALLDEGKRTKKSAYLITNSELRLATQTTKADQVEIDSEWYEVESKAKCASDVINHMEYIALKIENPV
jgi:hypothetical protein